MAIMLGRLHMKVEECIEVYKSLFKPIFENAGWKLNPFTGAVLYRYDATALEDEIKKVLVNRNFSADEPFFENRGICKV